MLIINLYSFILYLSFTDKPKSFFERQFLNEILFVKKLAKRCQACFVTDEFSRHAGLILMKPWISAPQDFSSMRIAPLRHCKRGMWQTK